MYEPGWITFHTAASKIKRRLGVNKAEAEARLRGACANEHMRSMKAPLDPDVMPVEFWNRVAPNEWRDRQVDYDGPDADGCEIVVMVNEEEFRDWLNNEPMPGSDCPRDAAIRKLLQAGLRPPPDWKEFYKKVRDEAEGGWINGKPGYGFSNKQITRRVAEILPTIVKKPARLTLQRVDKRMS